MCWPQKGMSLREVHGEKREQRVKDQEKEASQLLLWNHSEGETDPEVPRPKKGVGL